MMQRKQIVEQLHTLRDYLRWATSLMAEHRVYFGHGTDNAWDEAVYLVQAALHWPEPLEEKVLDSRLLPAERQRIVDWVYQRVEQRVPLPYITGQAWFAGMPFSIDRRAIIPRSPIAELIEQDFAPWYQGPSPERILDLCSGSGCIGIACAHYQPQARVDLVDISQAALDLAGQNIRGHGMGDRVVALQSDLFDGLAPADKRYDLIISNPPYVDAAELATMPREFHHEPTLALAAGEDGLELARRILREASDYLADHGLLVVEVGNSGEALEQAYPDVPFTWLEFERGGVGVFVLSAEELRAHRGLFQV